MKTIRIAAALALSLLAGPALAQSALSTGNASISVTTGNTYQSVAKADNTRRMLQVQNNQNPAASTDVCYVNDDGLVAAGNTTSTNVTTLNGTMVASKASIMLVPGEAYTRYYPYVPDGPIVATCATTGDSLYVGIH